MFNGSKGTGMYTVLLDDSGIASEVYLCRMKTGRRIQIHKPLPLKKYKMGATQNCF